MIPPSKNAKKQSRVNFESHKWQADLQYFEGPILSLFKKSIYSDVLYYWCDSDETINRWMVIDISRDHITRYINQEVTLRNIITTGREVSFVDIIGDGDIINTWILETQYLSDDYMPSESSFFEKSLAPSDLKLDPPTVFSVNIDGSWFLKDFSIFEKRFTQVYSFLYSLLNVKDNANISKLRSIYNALPWQGGASPVGFFNQLQNMIPSMHELNVSSMQYASPGSIKLSLNAFVAEHAWDLLGKTYENQLDLKSNFDESITVLAKHDLRKVPSFEECQKIDPQILSMIEGACSNLIISLGLEQHEDLINSLPTNQILKLKILQAFARRIFELHEFVNSGKVKI